MSSELIKLPLKYYADNISRPYKFKGKDKVIFINTGDVLEGKFLHSNYSKVKDLPGQAKKAIEYGDILYSEIRPGNRRFAFVDFDAKDYVVSTKFMVLKSKNIDSKYLYLILTNKEAEDEFKTIADSRSGTFPQITFDSISHYPILKLPREQQERIVDIIFSLNKHLDNNNQINQTLESISQTLFKSWFVDFDPVKSKIAAKEQGDDPQLAAMMAISGKSEDEINQMPADKRKQLAETADLFPEEMVESELGEIPKGWKWTAFGELLDKTVGGDWGQDQPDDKYTEEVKIIRGTDIPTLKNGGLEKIPTRYVEKKKLVSRKLEVGDIVIEISGGSKDQPTGRSIYITQNILNRLDGVAEPASFCRLFRPINEEIGLLLGLHLQYIYNAGKTWLYQNQSTGISNFQTTVFLDNEFIPFASDDLINAFYNKVYPLLNKITSNENITLSTIRDSLLPQLLTGSLQID